MASLESSDAVRLLEQAELKGQTSDDLRDEVRRLSGKDTPLLSGEGHESPALVGIADFIEEVKTIRDQTSPAQSGNPLRGRIVSARAKTRPFTMRGKNIWRHSTVALRYVPKELVNNGSLLLTPAMVREETRLGRGATYELVKLLPKIRHGRRILIPRAELERWIEENASI